MNIEFCTLTWRLGGITFYLTTEKRLNFQHEKFAGVYFINELLSGIITMSKILGTRCNLNRSKLAFILSPKKSLKRHLYKNGDKNHIKENYKIKKYMLLVCSDIVIIVQI